jgi:hypothetical protein
MPDNLQNDGHHHNHYVPKWYQKRFLNTGLSKYWYLDLKPDAVSNGAASWVRNDLLHWGPTRCFAQNDLYTTRWGNIDNTEIERFFFGEIDSKGKLAVEYFAEFTWPSVNESALLNLLTYMSVQKLRTPKGLGHLNALVRLNNQNLTMLMLQNIHMMYGAIWTESVWQIADASQSATKFIISDHPVTVYNRECFPESRGCQGFNDPDIRFVASHTYFPLSLNKILILTNLSWVRDPYQNPMRERPNPNFFRDAIFNFQDIQTDRMLSEQEVVEINFITKRRALRYIAAAEKDWLYPEHHLHSDHWRKLGNGYLFMPDPRNIYLGGEVIFGFDGGRPPEAFSEYGHRPWQEDYDSPERRSREGRSLERFKAEWAAMHGPEYRGVSHRFDGGGGRPPRLADSPEMHARYLARDAETRRLPGERQRRRRLTQSTGRETQCGEARTG